MCTLDEIPVGAVPVNQVAKSVMVDVCHHVYRNNGFLVMSTFN